MNSRLARDRAIVQLRDGRIGVLVFWPGRQERTTRAARVVFAGDARSRPVPPADVVEVLAPSSTVPRR